MPAPSDEHTVVLGDNDPTPPSRPMAHRYWPEAAVAIARVLSGNAVVLVLALKGMVPVEFALAALGLGMVPGAWRLLRGPGR